MRTLLFILLYRLGMLALTVAACAWLANRLDAPRAIFVWGVIMAAVCGSVALLMRRVPIGRVTWINRLAGIVLPFGYSIGRGKLLPIVLTSWGVWLILGAAATVMVSSGYDLRPVRADGQRHITAWLMLLLLSWLVDGFALLYLLRTLTTRLEFGSRAARSMMLLMAALLAMMGSSAILWSHGLPVTAVLLAGGPPLVVGGSYGLFVLVIIITRPRWN